MTQDDLKLLFNYKKGNLYWNKRVNPAVNIRKPAGCASNDCRVIRINKKLYLEHRLVFLFHYGYMPDYVDHINGNRSDNRVENLRECTKAQNCWNSKKPSTNTSGVKGVIWNKQNKSWRARFKCNHKIIEVGSFKCIEKAKKAIQEARELHHREFSNNG